MLILFFFSFSNRPGIGVLTVNMSCLILCSNCPGVGVLTTLIPCPLLPLVQHIVVAVKLILKIILPDVPSKVALAMRRVRSPHIQCALLPSTGFSSSAYVACEACECPHLSNYSESMSTNRFLNLFVITSATMKGNI